MDHRQDSALRSLAAAMAQELSTTDGSTALDLLRQMRLFSNRSQEDLVPPPKPGWVGIWASQTEGEEKFFQRSQERAGEWWQWADVDRLSPRGTKKRVVFIGESVARGYFYDPQLTPARVLEGLLGLSGVPGGVEVVDLAKTDLDGLSLGHLVSSSLALEPDLLVLFAGNNWAQAPLLILGGVDRIVSSTILRDQGVIGLKTFLDERLAGVFENQLARPLIQLSKRIPIVLIIPEFNLGDWRSDGMADAPWFPAADNERWLQYFQAAREAFEAGRLDEAEVMAREMVAIDRGTAASGFTILADCARRRGAEAEAIQFLEKARDSHSWEMGQTPRPLAFLQEALRRTAGQGNIKLVDLPRIFVEWLGGEVPDRRIFLDYCHLSAEGIRVAMAAAAEAAAPLLGGREMSHTEFAGIALAPSPEAEGEARLGAALHNAHLGQSFELVLHHCRSALAASRHVADAMAQYAELQSVRAPAWMCDAGEKLVQGATAGSLRRFLTHYMTYNRKILDPLLVKAITMSLEEIGISIAERIEAIRCEERGVTADREIDLLSPYFRPTWINRDWMWRQRFYQRIHSPVSEFSFICDGSSPIELQLVCRRIVDPVDEEACSLSVNGTLVETFACSQAWQIWRFSLPAQILHRGVNRVEIRWPLRTISGEEGLRQGAQDLENGIPGYDLIPFFAEVNSFTASIPSPQESSL